MKMNERMSKSKNDELVWFAFLPHNYLGWFVTGAICFNFFSGMQVAKHKINKMTHKKCHIIRKTQKLLEKIEQYKSA